jgi:hypothetical protein
VIGVAWTRGDDEQLVRLLRDNSPPPARVLTPAPRDRRARYTRRGLRLQTAVQDLFWAVCCAIGIAGMYGLMLGIIVAVNYDRPLVPWIVTALVALPTAGWCASWWVNRRRSS